ncbi:MAG: hypothetical protein ACYSTF_01115 [Planctomycetota bacterium]|jgi:tellurite resistance protein TehA-like permease
MNKKQLVTVWVGAALIIILTYWQGYEFCRGFAKQHVSPREAWIIATGPLPLVVAVLAVALTCTFADKKPKNE